MDPFQPSRSSGMSRPEEFGALYESDHDRSRANTHHSLQKGQFPGATFSAKQFKYEQ
jgi:hypothetical protein